MAVGEFICPIDDLPLALAVYTETGDVERDGIVGGHLHLFIDQTISCLVGHRWRFVGDVLMEREA